jgi:outer membrane protein TolC
MKFSVLYFIMFSSAAFAQVKVSVEEVVSLALQKNYDVQLARNTAQTAQTDDNYANYAFLPTLNGTGNITWNSNEQSLEFQDASRNNSGEAESNNMTGAVQLSWTLFDGSRMFLTRKRIGTVAEQNDLLLKNQMVNTISAVIAQYYDVVRQKQQLRALVEQMAVSEERVKLAERKLQVGTGAKPELLQAKVDYNAQRTQALQQKALIEQLKESLNALVDRQLPGSFDVADTILIDLSLQREEVMQNIQNNNFGLVAARTGMEAAMLSYRERRAELFPTINFNAAYSKAKTENIKLINPFAPLNSQSNGFNYGFLLTVPIFNGLNQHRLIQQAKITSMRSELLYRQLQLSVDVGLQNAFTQYENAKEVLVIEEENILLAKENVVIALESFKRGATTFVELRTAQQSLETAYNRLIAARYNAKVAETELLRLNGSLLREN